VLGDKTTVELENEIPSVVVGGADDASGRKAERV
jgi:hypothetical protein